MDRAKLVAIAGDLFKLHGLNERGWRLEFRNYGHRLGSCCSRRRIIALSAFYADRNTEAHVLDTLLHEIAHALVGPSHGHGTVWKAMARKLVCIPKACSKTGILVPPGKWQASCPTCARRFHKYRRPRYKHGYYCPSCGKDKGRLVFTAQVVSTVD
jgi:predicted SprT family Zn-dependent metalloprotease